MIIPIFFSANEAYAPYLLVTAISIMKHVNRSNFVNFHVLHQDISEKTKDIIKFALSEFENCKIEFDNVKKHFAKINIFTDGRIPIESYFRLIIPDLFVQYDKCIYIDCDTVVRHDISELYLIDVNDVFLAAARDADNAALFYKEAWRKEYINKVIGLKNEYDYFQAGVLLLNLRKFRELKPFNKIRKVISLCKWRFHDQCILNFLCKYHVIFLDYSWNFVYNGSNSWKRTDYVIIHAKKFIYEEYINSEKDPHIVHFSWFAKPWQDLSLQYAEDWWKIARISPYYSYFISKLIEKNDTHSSNENTIISLNDEILKLKSCNSELEFELNVIKSSKGYRILKLYYKLRDKLKESLLSFCGYFTQICRKILVNSTKISVIIPVKNGEKYLSQLFQSLKMQRGVNIVEIIVMLSESDDNSRKTAKLYGAKVFDVAQFSHSGTRLVGAKKAQSKYVLFLTQDACLNDRRLLSKMLDFLIKNSLIATSCTETYRDGCEEYYRLSFDAHVRYLGYFDDTIMLMPQVENYRELRRNANLSDVCCIYKRDVLLKLGMDSPFAEDIDFGLRAIKNGYKLGMLTSHKVTHSHNTTVLAVYERAYIDFVSIKSLFNIEPLKYLNSDTFIGNVKHCVEYVLSKIGSFSDKDFETVVSKMIESDSDYNGYLLSDRVDETIKDYLKHLPEHYTLQNDTIEKIFAANLGVFRAEYDLSDGENDDIFEDFK
jgi:lipopolysaccharide biosynthesis glycosyltransferase/glycosyltransferase involved in cell wall biosynthesis